MHDLLWHCYYMCHKDGSVADVEGHLLLLPDTMQQLHELHLQAKQL